MQKFSVNKVKYHDFKKALNHALELNFLQYHISLNYTVFIVEY